MAQRLASVGKHTSIESNLGSLMKHLFLALIAVLIVASEANAQVGPFPRQPTREEIDPGCHFRDNCWPRNRWPDDRNYPNRQTVKCAPEVVDGNVKATDRTLNALAASSQFAAAKTFRAQVSKISKMKQSADKADQYLALVGIDASNSEAVVDFIGAREVKAQWLSSLEKNSGLSSQQAEVVATKLQTVLRGGLQ